MRFFTLLPFRFPLSPFAFCLLPFLIGCGGGKPPPTPVLISLTGVQPKPQEPLPTELRGERLETAILESLRKRVMGRRATLPDVKRMVTEIHPIVVEAARQPSTQATFRALARDEGISVEEARSRWISLQEADLMLESGGDPEAVSVSNAVGVAQWIAPTAHDQGVPVNLRESNRLTAKIDPLKREILWLNYLLRPDADPTLPGAPAVTREQAAERLPKLRQELALLRAKRRKVDHRYDPRRAIFAHTRYLLRLYPRFPAMDWIFQAYHGGEGGATRTLKRYLGPAWPGSTAAAIRYGKNGSRLRFADVYLNATPLSHSEAFFYVYGRSDDHRHYWWKLLVCQQTIARYRRDPAAFQREWESLLPGRTRDAVFYPNGPDLAFPNTAAQQTARKAGQLVPIVVTSDFLPLNTTLLRPESLGLLRLIANTYRQNGGKSRIQIGDTTLTPDESERLQKKRKLPEKRPPLPPDPEEKTLPGGGPPAEFDYHTTGLAYDLLKPANSRDRRILDYAIGVWEDRLVVARREERDAGPPRWHLLPNPRFTDALIR
jgi:hypothetical protein